MSIDEQNIAKLTEGFYNNSGNRDLYSLYIQNMPEKESVTFIPIMELYEYDIVGYPTLVIDPIKRKHINIQSSFGNIIDSPRDSCGKIKIKDHGGSPDGNGVCDSISSQDGGDTYDIDDFYANYKEWKTRIDIKEFTKTLPIEKIEEIEKLFGEAEKIMKIISNDTNGDYIYVLDVKKTDKIILFGDHHGSYHTFFRNLLRLHKFGVLNLDNFTINDGYKLIFIGDIVDRGSYALEIVYVLCKLIINNNTDKNNPKILYNRGNHEEKPQANKDGFKNEIKTKTTRKYDENDDDDTNWLFEGFFSFINKCPSAIIINVDNQKRFWIAHGGIPLPNERSFLRQYDSAKKTIDINDLIARQIRWNDFSVEKYSTINYSRSSRWWNDILTIGKEETEQFLRINNIDFIIRGHQDSYYNSFFHNNNYYVVQEYEGKYNAVDNGQYCEHHYVNKSEKIYGAKARFIPDKQYFTDVNIIPVITISTNTDYERPLVKDSFAVLRFDINDISKIPFEGGGSVKSVFEVLDKTKEIGDILDKIGKSIITDTDKKTIKIKSNVAGTIKITEK